MVEQNSSLAETDKKPPRRPTAPLMPVLLGLLVVCAIGAFGYATQSGVTNSRGWLLHTYEVRSQLQALETQLAEARANALAFVASGDERQLRDFRTHSTNVARLIENLRKLTADNPRQQFRLGEMESLSAKYLAELESTVAAATPRSSLSPAEAASIRSLDSQESRQNALVRSMADDEQMLLEGRLNTWNRFFLRNAFILAITFAVALVFLAFNFRLLTREISRTREMERLQRESGRSSRALSTRILELQDTERRKVARELHDSVGQYLVSLKINLEQLLETNPDLKPAHAKLLADTVDLTERSIAEVRTISHLLHPPLLDEVGFESAARWYADGFATRSGLKVNLQLAEIANRLPKQVELTLFRVLQESLTNVHRHADARSVEIVLVCRDGRVILTVQDDGRGISHEILARFRSGLASGVGLAGMRERLTELDGVLEVETRTRGTTLRAKIPVVECASDLTRLETSRV
jgi:signal transduction histidine kinase